jgi:uncharacterized protein involved in exopolysaccharide biosynthesis
MTQLNGDRTRLPTVSVDQRFDFRSHYETLAIDMLQSVRRQWQLILLIVALAVALACLALPLIPRKYSATALVVPNLYSQEQSKSAALASVDATSIVNGEARLILSDGSLQSVVRRLNPEQRPHVQQRWELLRIMFFPETRAESEIDREVATLRSKVEVAKDTRSYLISISFTASSADEAARVVNAIAIEYLRDKWMQRKSAAVGAAEVEFGRQLAVNGDKHPKVMQAADVLDAVRADLKAFTSSTDDVQALVGPEEGVRLAVPNRTPTSPKGKLVLGLACMVGLTVGVSLAVWRDWRHLKPFDVAAVRQSGLRSLVAPRPSAPSGARPSAMHDDANGGTERKAPPPGTPIKSGHLPGSAS